MTEVARARVLAFCYAATILVGAFLVFQVQPVVSKTILPWFGGSPAVWTTCMLFFQVLLFGGYLYAHLLTSRLRPAWQGVVHLTLLAAAIATLPLTLSADWKPTEGSNPTWHILMLLGATVGVPYFLLSSTGPLAQAWFSRSFPGRSPYRLYALSNAGSLAALLTYPVLFEPVMTTGEQASAWSFGFYGFALVCGYLAIVPAVGRTNFEPALTAAPHPDAIEPSPITWTRRILWILLPAFASMMLLATTNHVCQDVAVVPFLWVVPLSLYLLSFIICFDSPRWYARGPYAVIAAAGILGATAMLHWGVSGKLLLEVGVYFITLFALCMLCHGELVRLKPAPSRLTEFYLSCAAGGALGGIAVAVLCPLMFSTYAEMNIGMMVGFALALAVLATRVPRASWNKRLGLAALVVAVGLLGVIKIQAGAIAPARLAAVRNFYGVLHVEDTDVDKPEMRRRVLFHGRIIHGYQMYAEQRRREPTTYYDRASGVAVAITRLPKSRAKDGPMRVGVIGLGAGTLAAYCQPGDHYRFYEINPAVLDLAKQHFSFLSDAPGKVEVVLGDARLSMEREPDQHYDVIVLDAFSGDSIPAHLLTAEAFEVYRRHLAPDGVIAAHVSNRHLDLRPLLSSLAELFAWDAISVSTHSDDERAAFASEWVLLTSNRRFLRDEVVRASAGQLGCYAHAPLWTDEYSNLLQLLK